VVVVLEEEIIAKTSADIAGGEYSSSATFDGYGSSKRSHHNGSSDTVLPVHRT